MEALRTAAGCRHSRFIRRFSRTLCVGPQDQSRCYTSFRQHGVPAIKPVTSWGVAMPPGLHPDVDVLVEGEDFNGIDIAKFKAQAFDPEKPLLMKVGPHSTGMPAIKKWFGTHIYDCKSDEHAGAVVRQEAPATTSDYLRQFSATTILPYELAYPQMDSDFGDVVQNFIERLIAAQDVNPKIALDPTSWPEVMNLTNLAPLSERALGHFIKAQLPPETNAPTPETILRFQAPLALLDAAHTFNQKRPRSMLRRLYVAQALLTDLPKELQDDLPVPNIVKLAGKGDIYDSSIWLGIQPTYTTLHRDPNPNLFVQLCSNKKVRLLPPASGNQLYRDVQNRLVGHGLRSHSRLRGPEMMAGPESELLREAVWGVSEADPGSDSPPKGLPTDDQHSLYRSRMQEAHLTPGDALFIPKGWWHSVASDGDDGCVNGSVNWWFR